MNIALVVSLAAGVMLPSAGSAPDQDAPPVALRTIVQTFQDVWATHDAARLTELFTDDADQIMGNGPASVGRPAIRRWWEARFAGMEQGRSITLTVSSVRLISPDAGVINTVAVSGGRDPQGQPLPSNTDRGSWVVVNRAGQWRIAALRVYDAEGAPSR
jgi:uncharacterized protein (TIGR02246 family)